MTAFGKIPLGLLKLLVNLMFGVEFAKNAGVKDNHLRLAVIARNKIGSELPTHIRRTRWVSWNSVIVIVRDIQISSIAKA